jgi:hypothetical protein
VELQHGAEAKQQATQCIPEPQLEENHHIRQTKKGAPMYSGLENWAEWGLSARIPAAEKGLF